MLNRFSNLKQKIRPVRIVLWTLIWIITLLVGGELFIRSQTLWKFGAIEPYMLFSGYGKHHYSAFEIQRIKNRNKSDYDEYYVLLGGSAAGLECFTSDKQVSNFLSKKTRKKIGFSSIAASFHTFSDEIKVMNELKDADVTFILGLEALRVWRDKSFSLQFYEKSLKRHIRKYYYLQLPEGYTKFLKRQGIEVPLSQHLLSLNFWPVMGEGLKKEVTRWLKTGHYKRAYNRHSASNRKKGLTLKRAKAVASKLSSSFKKQYGENSDRHFTILEKLIEFVEDNNLRLIVFDLPQPEDMLIDLEIMAPDYTNRISSIVQKHNLTYFYFQNDIEWNRTYYHDAHHMVKAGQTQFTILFTDKLAKHIIQTFKQVSVN